MLAYDIWSAEVFASARASAETDALQNKFNNALDEYLSWEKENTIMPEKSNFPQFKVQTLASGPKHHFFGYYGMPPWNKSQRYMVCLESDFHDRLPTADEPASVGLVDVKTGCFKKVMLSQSFLGRVRLLPNLKFSRSFALPLAEFYRRNLFLCNF